MGLANLLNRELPVNNNSQGMVFEERKDFPRERTRNCDFLFQWTRAQDGSNDSRAFAQHETKINLAPCAGHGADQHDSSPMRQSLQTCSGIGSAGKVEHHIKSGCRSPRLAVVGSRPRWHKKSKLETKFFRAFQLLGSSGCTKRD